MFITKVLFSDSRIRGGEVATAGEDCTIPISALHGTGLSDLLQRLEHAVIARTKRKFWKIILPLDGPELRSVNGLIKTRPNFGRKNTSLCFESAWEQG